MEIRECRRRGCHVAALEDSEFCDEHARRQRQYNAAYMSRRRAAWGRRKRCTNCGAGKRRPQSKWCAACALRDRRMKIPSVNQQVENKSARIASATARGKDGRERYHGTGQRGRRSIEDENRADFDLIEREIAEARKADAYAWSLEVQSLPRIQRDAVHLAVGDRIQMAKRLLNDIQRRLKHPGVSPEIGDSAGADED